ncbi:hypothetical protein JHD50_07560 [Sulfurimonas sp. MAG313]|nr:hypothetical protein [Sulfurimonas sp. MAG313]MDF1881158.1 hypothetical protein [Sulfurimonas sp. MAG313]
MTPAVVRKEILSLIIDTQANGATMSSIGPILGYSTRTIKRWKDNPEHEDKRSTRVHKEPSNK